MTLLALYLLATADAACSGYRAAAGRNALIRKRAYYTRWMLLGALAGQAVLFTAAIAVAAARGSADSSEAHVFQSRLLAVYLPYAAAIGLAFLVRVVPSVDLRSMTSTLVFGPLTVLRPVVAVGGLLWAALPAPTAWPTTAAIGIVAAMLAMERMLSMPWWTK